MNCKQGGQLSLPWYSKIEEKQEQERELSRRGKETHKWQAD